MGLKEAVLSIFVSLSSFFISKKIVKKYFLDFYKKALVVRGIKQYQLSLKVCEYYIGDTRYLKIGANFEEIRVCLCAFHESGNKIPAR